MYFSAVGNKTREKEEEKEKKKRVRSMVVNDCYYRGRAKESSDVLEADAAHAQRAFEEAHEAVSNKVENPTQPTPLRDASRAAHALGVERVLVKGELALLLSAEH